MSVTVNHNVAAKLPCQSGQLPVTGTGGKLVTVNHQNFMIIRIHNGHGRQLDSEVLVVVACNCCPAGNPGGIIRQIAGENPSVCTNLFQLLQPPGISVGIPCDDELHCRLQQVALARSSAASGDFRTLMRSRANSKAPPTEIPVTMLPEITACTFSNVPP